MKISSVATIAKEASATRNGTSASSEMIFFLSCPELFYRVKTLE